MPSSQHHEIKPQLTQREQQVLGLVCHGCLNKDIADRLGIAVQTVNAHLHNVYRKLLARNRLDAVRLYNQHLSENGHEKNESRSE